MKVLSQEIEVWYIIPAIRKNIAVCLIKDFDYSYDKVGTAIGVSKAAVSQYVKNKRASKIFLSKKIDPELAKSCKLISEGKSNAVVEIKRILEVIREKNLPCEVCGDAKDDVLKDCKEIRLGDYV